MGELRSGPWEGELCWEGWGGLGAGGEGGRNTRDFTPCQRLFPSSDGGGPLRNRSRVMKAEVLAGQALKSMRSQKPLGRIRAAQHDDEFGDAAEVLGRRRLLYGPKASTRIWGIKADDVRR